MNPQELKERTKQFALRVMRLVDALPNTPKGHAMAGQLVRSGTSVAANYRAACRGRSRAEFISKIGVAEEEADETALWLELIIADKNLADKKVLPLLTEANELLAILAASYISASRNKNTRVMKSQSAISNQQSAIKNRQSAINNQKSKHEQRIYTAYSP
jgi:four helix bundle protein